VRVYFTRSGLDFVESDPVVSTYGVWRRVDNPKLKAPSQPLSGGFPPGTWEHVGSFASLQQHEYIFATPTLADSGEAGIPYAVYCVSAHIALSPEYYVCPPESGYSVDNIPPSPPPGLRMETPTRLAWEEVPDEDLLHYAVYGSERPDPGEGGTPIGCTTDLMMDVSAHVFDYYHVTATDHSGNEGEASSIANTYAGVHPAVLPEEFALRQNRPNPFTVSTVIRFDLPEPTRVVLEVFDIEGRLVATLTDEVWGAGRHRVTWDGNDGLGNHLGPGVYFVRMRAAEFSEIGKTMLLR
jgi:hypothetical protein